MKGEYIFQGGILMNSYERYRRMIEGEKTDFVPRTPILMRYAAEYIGSNYGEFASNHKVLVEANLRCAEDFGMDQVSCISDPYRETHGFGGEIEYVPDGVPRCTSPLKDSKDMKLLKKPDPHSSERMLDRVKAVELFKEKAGNKYSILGWIEGPAAEAADLRGVSNFLVDIMLDEPFACELMDRCMEVAIQFGKAQIEAGCDTIGIGDAIASQISAPVYEKVIQPREKELVKELQDAGAYVKIHICGDITHLLDGIADLGMDLLDVDHMVDMKKVREKMGRDVVITGNIDPANGVARGTPDRIYESICSAYEMVGNPYMANAGCEIPSGTPPENLEALCKPVPFKTSAEF
jgi:MtaA/CmuA family methyltransferase